MSGRAEEIKRAFAELHGGSIKQSLHDAAVELLVTQRQGVKPDQLEQAKAVLRKTSKDGKLWSKYNQLKDSGHPMVDQFSVVLQHVLSNKKIRDSLSGDPAAPSGSGVMATPLTVNKLTFASAASPATPLTTPGAVGTYSAVKGAPGVNPQRLFQSPAGGSGSGAPGPSTSQAAGPGTSRLAGTTKNPLFDSTRNSPDGGAGGASEANPSSSSKGRDLVPPLNLSGGGSSGKASGGAGKASDARGSFASGGSGKGGHGGNGGGGGSGGGVRSPTAGAKAGSSTARLATASSKARQITKEELQRRAQVRIEKADAAAAKAARHHGSSHQSAAAQHAAAQSAAAAAAAVAAVAAAASDTASDGAGTGDSSRAGTTADGSPAFGGVGGGGLLGDTREAQALLQALREGGGAGVPPPGSGLAPDALPGSLLNSQYKNPMYGQYYRNESSPTKQSPSGCGPYTPVMADTLRLRPLDAYKLGPSLPDCGDLFLAGQPADGPPDCPPMPEWWHEREYQTTDFLLMSAMERPEPAQPLEQLPPVVQEYMVANDLLYAFLGFNGQYVYAHPSEDGGSVCYSLDAQLEPSIMELTSKLLPLCEYVAVVQRFVETRCSYGSGLVAQAVSAAMRGLLEDWEVMVMQLEHQLRLGRLSLQALWYHCQQPLATLRLVAAIAAEAAAEKLTGADLLNLLYVKESAVAGDMQARRLVQRLLQAGAAPYFRMLQRWLCEGVVEDPYGEFMVQEDKEVTKSTLSEDEQSAYWLHRYSLRVAFDSITGEPRYDESGMLAYDVPLFLDKVRDTILTTGKYLNAIRECGRQPTSPLEPGEAVAYDQNERHITQINRAFRGSSAALLRVMKGELGLMPKLRSMKQYFLCDRGDLLVAFVDIAEEELNKRAHEVSLVRLQNMLELAVRTSSAASDPNSEDLKCMLDYRSLLGMLKHIMRVPDLLASSTGAAGGGGLLGRKPGDKHGLGGMGGGAQVKLTPFGGGGGLGGVPTPRDLGGGAGGGNPAEQKLLQARTGREAFLLTYKVDWPLSVVVSEASLTQYQLVFRHLFELKYVERELNAIWRIYQATKDIYSAPSDTLRRCYGLCQQMSHFFREYLLYLTFEVLEPLWHTFEAQVTAATNIDEVVSHHQSLLRRIMKGCLLSRRVKLLRTLVELKALALKFAEITSRIKIPDYSMFEFEAEDAAAAKALPDWQKRRLRAQTVHDIVQQAVESSAFDKAIRDLQATFNSKFRDFILQIGEIYRAAQKTAEESREELESLLNLINRLDFNDYFKGKVDYRAILESSTGGSSAAAATHV